MNCSTLKLLALSLLFSIIDGNMHDWHKFSMVCARDVFFETRLPVRLQTQYIEPGSSWKNGYCESFNSKPRAKLLDRELFTNLAEKHFTMPKITSRTEYLACSNAFSYTDYLSK